MYLRKITIRRQVEGKPVPCPIQWLDSFAMRNFTNDPVFDDTLPVADGIMEIGSRVPLDHLHRAMEDWFRRKSYLGKDAALLIEEQNTSL